MILEKIALEPFAGFPRKEFQFVPGLNVVLGPNDVGKSSLFRAIESALLLPVKVKANTIEGRALKRILPLGGDHAQVKLDFLVKGEKYRLGKVWGANFSARLSLPGGTELTAHEAVEAKLAGLLPAPSATVSSVLLMPQNTLEHTKEELEKNQDSLHSLGDALRKAVELAGGVSVEKMKAELGRRLEDLLSNWDIAAGAPKGMRGIENPWQKNVGSVLAAYYERETLKKKLNETLALESELGEKLRSLAEKQSRMEEARAFLQANQAGVEAVAERLRLEAEKRQAEKDLHEITRDFTAWVQAESDRKLLEGEVARLTEKKKSVEIEWKGAQAAAEGKMLLARFEKIQGAASQLKAAQKTLAEGPVLRTEEMKRILELAAAAAQARAGQIKLQFVAREKMELSIQKNNDPARSGTIEAGKSMTIQSGARVQIQSAAFDLVVTSGEGKVVEADTGALAAALEKHDVKTPEEAQEKHEKWLAASVALREAEGVYRALIGKDDFAALEAKVNAAGAAAGGRGLEAVEKEFQEVNARFTEKKGALAVAQRLLQELAKRYGETDSTALTRLLGKRTADSASLTARLEALPPLAGGDDFVAKYRKLQAEQPGLAEELRLVSNSVADLKARLPAESAQEYDRLHRDAAENFQLRLKKAKALLRVEEAVRTLEQAAGDIYRDFRSGFTKFVKELSAGKYSQARMEETLPSEFLRHDGAEIPFEWLSAGTKDAFALALRLSMARHFLGEHRGFLLIDDPMVAMDPERQQAVAALLRAFADRAQIVLFTCHPAHAELLGGNTIRFS